MNDDAFEFIFKIFLIRELVKLITTFMIFLVDNYFTFCKDVILSDKRGRVILVEGSNNALSLYKFRLSLFVFGLLQLVTILVSHKMARNICQN